MLANRKQVGQRLAGVQEVAERVDDRHVRPACELFDALMPIGADHDAVEIAREDARRIRDRLAAPELEISAAEKERAAAELVHADLKRDARTRRGFFKDHAERLAREQRMRDPRLLPRLEIRCQCENLLHITHTEIMNRNQIHAALHHSPPW